MPETLHTPKYFSNPLSPPRGVGLARQLLDLVTVGVTHDPTPRLQNRQTYAEGQ